MGGNGVDFGFARSAGPGAGPAPAKIRYVFDLVEVAEGKGRAELIAPMGSTDEMLRGGNRSETIRTTN